MRVGAYFPAKFRNMRLVPFAYRCSQCGALNDGFYPADASVVADELTSDSLSASGRELTDAESLSRSEREMRLIAARMKQDIAEKKWNGSATCIAQCGACGQKMPWSRQSMRTSDWIFTLLIPFGIGMYELLYEGFYYHEPRAILYGTILLAMSVVLMLIIALIMGKQKRRIYKLPPESFPTPFSSVEELEAWLNEARRDGEPLYRSIDPRSPDTPYLSEQNEAVQKENDPEPIVLCKWCLQPLNRDNTRIYNGKKYCSECYGIVRQEAEIHSFNKSHRKRGGEIM
ncbi:MAG: hypothetical protein IK127_01815 [Clostridia bacterium]|nr:hypothetical protein [Clostridia bacterium]